MCAVSVDHRPVRPPAVEPGADLASPPAKRVQRGRWRDPRLWLGVVLVVASIVVGARLFAASDDTVAVWVLDVEGTAGMDVGADDVRAVDVHFGNASDAGRYLVAGASFPPGLHLVHDVAAGELLAVTAVTDAAGDVPAQLPLGVPGSGMPSDLARGDVVEVWAVPTGADRQSSLVLGSVPVVAVAAAGQDGVSGDRQVLVSLPDDVDLAAVLDRLREASVVLIRVGG